MLPNVQDNMLGMASQSETKSHISEDVLPRRVASQWAHANITSPLHHLKYFCSARFVVNITHKHDNDRT